MRYADILLAAVFWAAWGALAVHCGSPASPPPPVAQDAGAPVDAPRDAPHPSDDDVTEDTAEEVLGANGGSPSSSPDPPSKWPQ